MPGAEAVKERLESAFNRIQRELMQDVPLLNPVLQVEAVGFQHWQNTWTGVLITPWFMNLIQFPEAQEDWSWQWPGQSLGRQLPAGFFEFSCNHEEETGAFLSCSLFSPMHEFPDQRTAVATAEAVMAHVMTPQETSNGHKPFTRRDFLKGRK